MPKVTATITNVVQEGNGFRVFWVYSDNRADESQVFDVDTTKDQVKSAIKARLNEINAAYDKANSLKDLIEKVID